MFKDIINLLYLTKLIMMRSQPIVLRLFCLVVVVIVIAVIVVFCHI